jgi:hypothetical protein
VRIVRSVLVWTLYAVISLFVTLTWFHYARTETLRPEDHFNSIQALVDGTVTVPFLRRRLMPDAATALSKALPPAGSAVYDRLVALDLKLAGRLGGTKSPISDGWDHTRLPLLVASFIVIAGSVFGFTAICRALVRHFYVAPSWMTDGLAGLLGISLLGSSTDLHYALYPYDYPQACVFSLGILGVVKRAWWFVPVFLVAAYSKETSLLLVVALVAVTWEPGSWRRLTSWLAPIALTLAFLAVRSYIAWRYPAVPTTSFWWPTRNLGWMRNSALLFSWMLPFFLVGFVRIGRMLPRVPVELRRLTCLLPILLGLSFFKGWIEEMRQYGELLAILGLVVAQWLSEELGFERFLVPRAEQRAN